MTRLAPNKIKKDVQDEGEVESCLGSEHGCQ